MFRNGRELWAAFIAAILITTVYAAVVIFTRQIPPAREIFGLSLGILGFILMLMTEILYSLRKRSHLARWGRMSDWLEFHVFTGLVGPYMVLLHTSWKFNGLAGVITLFTIVIVVSGFIGRYIYTRIPRTVDGVEILSGLSTEAVKQARRLMSLWHSIHIPLGIVLFVAAFVHIGGAIYFALLLR
jgi:hypothetical protein